MSDCGLSIRRTDVLLVGTNQLICTLWGFLAGLVNRIAEFFGSSSNDWHRACQELESNVSCATKDSY